MSRTASEQTGVASRPNNRPQRWCDALPAVTAEIDCGGQRHRITWRRGKLVLEDHDLLAERSLEALGSSNPPLCVEVLDAWRRTRGTELLGDLLLSDRALPPEQVRRRRRRYEEAKLSPWVRAPNPTGPSAIAQWGFKQRALDELDREKRLWEIALIDSLPAALRRALAASMIVTLKRHWDDESYRLYRGYQLEPAFAATATPLLERSARRWRGSLKPQAILTVESQVLPPGEPASCWASVGATGAFAALSLPLSWFLDVWARGIALVDGCFVLRLDGTPDETSLRVVALRWERDVSGDSRPVQAPAVVTRCRGDEWSLHWL